MSNYQRDMSKYRTNCRAAIALFKDAMSEQIKEHIRGISTTKEENTREQLQKLIITVFLK